MAALIAGKHSLPVVKQGLEEIKLLHVATVCSKHDRLYPSRARGTSAAPLDPQPWTNCSHLKQRKTQRSAAAEARNLTNLAVPGILTLVRPGPIPATAKRLSTSPLLCSVLSSDAPAGGTVMPSIECLVIDFDSTCTEEDTSPLLIQLAVEAAAEQQDATSLKILREKLANLVESYSRGYSQAVDHALEEALRTYPEDRSGGARPYNVEGLRFFLERMSVFELAATSRVVEARVLRGVTRERIRSAVPRVPLRPGCRVALQRFASNGNIKIHVLTGNWSTDLVTSTLPVMPAVRMHCNDLEFDGAGVSTGGILGDIHTPLEKERIFSTIISPSRSSSAGSQPPPGGGGLTACIGDSLTDLLALVNADVGIVVGQNKTLRRVIAAFGLPLLPLPSSSALPDPPRGVGLLEAQSWADIESFVLSANQRTAPCGGQPSSISRAPHREDNAELSQSEWREAPPPRVLAVASSDAGGGAGIQADMLACAARGAYCMTAISALTAKDMEGVQGVHVVPPEFLVEQMRSVLSDIGADVVKTGMLPTPEIIHALCDVLTSHSHGALVVDPVMAAKSGDMLAGEDTLQALRERLLPMADLVTPNIPEACRILGRPLSSLKSLHDAQEAARAIHSKGPRFVLVKGGHFEDENEAVDILFDGKDYHEFRAPRVRARHTHETGCVLASAIAAELAKGAPMLDAVRAAEEYIIEALMEESEDLQIGRGALGPLNHRFPVADTSVAPGPAQGTGWPTPGSPRWRFRGTDLFLYAVTDSAMNAKWDRTNEEAVAAAIEGGATFLQLREKDMDTGSFVREARRVVELARASGVPLVINDRIDVALAVGADGVHIGQSDMPVAVARQLIGSDRILGVSCDTPAQALQAAADGADYVGCGPVFVTETKKSKPPIGVEGLLSVCQASPIPTVAIGGIKAANVGGMLTSGRGGPGPFGVAIVSGVFDQPDVVAATHELYTSLKRWGTSRGTTSRESQES